MNVRPSIGQSAPAQAWRRWRDTASTQWRAWWQQRPPREQKLLQIGGVIVVATLGWLVAVRPALDTVAASRTQLPLLRAQAIQVNALILEAQSLQHGQSGRIAAADMQAAILGSLRRIGLDDRASLQAIDAGNGAPRQWDIALDDANASRVIDWLAELPSMLQVRIRDVSLDRSQRDGRERPGNVSGRVTIELPQEPA